MFSSEKCTFDKNLGFIDQISNAQLVGNFPNVRKITTYEKTVADPKMICGIFGNFLNIILVNVGSLTSRYINSMTTMSDKSN